MITWWYHSHSWILTQLICDVSCTYICVYSIYMWLVLRVCIVFVTYTRIHMLWLCAHVCTCTWVCTQYVRMCAQVCVCAYMNICTTWVCTWMRTCACVCMCGSPECARCICACMCGSPSITILSFGRPGGSHFLSFLRAGVTWDTVITCLVVLKSFP